MFLRLGSSIIGIIDYICSNKQSKIHAILLVIFERKIFNEHEDIKTEETEVS